MSLSVVVEVHRLEVPAVVPAGIVLMSLEKTQGVGFRLNR
jgi:hypothetical protein